MYTLEKPIAKTANQSGCKTKTKVAIAGATGYVGQELIRLLLQHPEVEIVAVASNSNEGAQFEEVFPGFSGLLSTTFSAVDLEALAEQSDVLFLALPHGVAGSTVSASVLAKTKVIDLSGDFRIQDPAVKAQWYGEAAGVNKNAAIYGICELNRKAIKHSTFIANPGCYATAAILALAPLLKAGLITANSIIIDGKSGVSGAGRAASLKTHFNECNESMKAYQLPTHRHTPEIEETLSQFTSAEVISTFAAHLVPMQRGILLTAYGTLTKPVSDDEVSAAYKELYEGEPFIRMISPGKPMPETRWVRGSNYCDIGFAVDRRSNRIVVVSAIDNLIKGAAGQAVQNMNIILGIDETTGLNQIPTFL
jgi:N-acetyl-gamma-glutamyl-phosphate reductase